MYRELLNGVPLRDTVNPFTETASANGEIACRNLVNRAEPDL